jgi:hypothetical protein
MRITTSQAAQLPWVTRLDRTQDCDGYRWAHMPLRALGNPELLAWYKCRNRARWQFRELGALPVPARGGTYCWAHLMAQLLANPAEEERVARALT